MLMSAVASAMLGTLFGCYYAPHLTRYPAVARLKRRLAQTRSLVLTYDDGPGTLLTPQLLDLLDSLKAKATFFLLGMRVTANPQIVDRIIRDGHEVGSHGDKHVHAWKAWPWRVLNDVHAGYGSISAWVPSNAPYRPPHGKLSLPLWLSVRCRRSPLGWWTSDSRDSYGELPDPQEAAERLVGSDGGVVLMHDFWADPQHMDYVLRLTELVVRSAPCHGLTIRRFCDLQTAGK
ncbi:MAG: polysaccharide deacetylase family protein [Planctomycetota bacterium]|nr:polysaccharide deacetylase family protein [Planctomycetota bacterium]